MRSDEDRYDELTKKGIVNLNREEREEIVELAEKIVSRLDKKEEQQGVKPPEDLLEEVCPSLSVKCSECELCDTCDRYRDLSPAQEDYIIEEGMESIKEERDGKR